LIESFNFMKKDQKSKDSIRELQFDSLKGQEKNPDFFLCGILNLMLNDITTPNVLNTNSLSRPTSDIPIEGEFDLIMSNPSYNEPELDNIQNNLPDEVRSKDTALHFLYFIMEELKNEGRAAMIVPNGVLFGDGKAATLIFVMLEKARSQQI